jgi:hypothetical protein
VTHANRQVVKSSTYKAKGDARSGQSGGRNSGNTGGRVQTSGGRNTAGPTRIGQGTRPTYDHSVGATGNRQFTQTTTGRQYDNGLVLHNGIRDTTSWQRGYFPGGSYHYPYYSSAYGAGDYYSPFGFYFGICDPYILGTGIYVYPPTDAYVNYPIYSGAVFSRWTDTDDNAFDQQDLNAVEPGLLNATDEISETYHNGNIDALVSLIDPNMTISIYTQGKYRYSMKANDYLDLTRDTIKSVKTVSLSLDYLHQDSPTVYTLSGKQVYIGKNGQDRAVYLSFVLQDVGGHWTLTQAGTSPDRIQAYG